jgi:hypothetical protein
MDNFNKIISFILGLVVVIVFFGIITRRINLNNKIPFISGLQTKNATPTPSNFPTPISTITISENSQSNNSYQTKRINSIPATGSPSEVLIIASFLSGFGFYLRSINKTRNP